MLKIFIILCFFKSMSEEIEEKIIEFTIDPSKVKTDRLMQRSKEIEIKATISSKRDNDPPMITITDPNGKRDGQRALTVDGTSPITNYIRTFGVDQNSPSGDYNVKLVYTGLPPKEGSFNVEFVEIK